MFYLEHHYRSASLALAIVLLFTAHLITSCSRRGVPGSDEEPTASPPSQRMEDFKVVESRMGLKQWELRAISAEAYDDRGEIVAEGIVVDYYDGGKVSSTMRADRGRLDQRSHDLEASSHVVIVSVEDGTRLETEALWWDNSKEVIHTDRPVVMTTKEDDRIEGTGMEALPNMKIITVENVRGVIKNVSRVEKRLNIDG